MQQRAAETTLWLSVVIPCCNALDCLMERGVGNSEPPIKKASHGRLT